MSNFNARSKFRMSNFNTRSKFRMSNFNTRSMLECLTLIHVLCTVIQVLQLNV